jgi:tyrosine-protein kinase Etk/Wzc
MITETVAGNNAELLESDQYAGEIFLLTSLLLIGQKRRFVAIITLGAALLTLLIVFLIPNEYTAATLILPPAQNSSMSSALMSQLGNSAALASVAGAGLGIKNPSDMYVALFHSRTVEDAVIRRFGLMARYRAKNTTEARTEFEDHSAVILGTKDGLIRITIRDRDPRFAADIANGYLEEFRKLSANLAITEASQRRVFFQQQLAESNANLVASEEAMKRTQQSTGIIQIDSQSRALIESAAALRAQVAAKQVQLQAMRSYGTEANPDIVTAKDQLAGLQSQLAKLSGTGGDPNSDMIVPRGKVTDANMEYLRKLRDLKFSETVTEMISKQFEAAKLDEAREGAIVQVVDPAVPPDKKSSPHRLLIVLLITLVAFLSSVLWILSKYRWMQMMRDPERLAKIEAFRLSLSRQQRQ